MKKVTQTENQRTILKKPHEVPVESDEKRREQPKEWCQAHDCRLAWYVFYQTYASKQN